MYFPDISDGYGGIISHTSTVMADKDDLSLKTQKRERGPWGGQKRMESTVQVLEVVVNRLESFTTSWRTDNSASEWIRQ